MADISEDGAGVDPGASLKSRNKKHVKTACAAVPRALIKLRVHDKSEQYNGGTYLVPGKVVYYNTPAAARMIRVELYVLP